MSDGSHPLPSRPATAGDPVKRDWRTFTVTLIAGTIAFAALLGMHYMPEAYQKLTALTALGIAVGFFLVTMTPLAPRECIGVAAFFMSLTTSFSATGDHLLAAWILCIAGGLTSVVILALRWSEPLRHAPGSSSRTPL
ncbi:hypothetical protein NPJ82_16220 (plasmid) [Sphingomonas sp. NY01]|uniref:hypothetical protein n=1 Tax=Sphingomonas sp. NY01 TaxID=2968057 RepID=UPI00315DA363